MSRQPKGPADPADMEMPPEPSSCWPGRGIVEVPLAGDAREDFRDRETAAGDQRVGEDRHGEKVEDVDHARIVVFSGLVDRSPARWFSAAVDRKAALPRRNDPDQREPGRS